jgi:hypothetical protein
MILSDLKLGTRANCVWTESGIDSLEKCRDKKRFINYPDKIEYRYNSRGLRDDEWPQDLQSAIWCVGDSFTAGIGTPYEHIWPQKLSALTGRRTINVAMDGASNNWIARRVRQISDQVNPDNIVVMWSTVERREKPIAESVDKFFQKFYNEVKDSSWPVCPPADQFKTLPLLIRQEIAKENFGSQLKISEDLESIEIINLDEFRIMQIVAEQHDHLTNFKNCFELIKDIESNLIYSFIPGFAEEKYQKDYVAICTNGHILSPIKKLDLARDGLHFDRITSQWLAEKIAPLLK